MSYLEKLSNLSFSICRIVLCVFCVKMLSVGAYAQGKQHVMVKTFDPTLKKMGNLELSINGKPFIKISEKGETLTELDEADIPLKSITIKDEQYEAASWNYSKGVIEVIVRKKNYRIAHVYVQDSERNTLKNVSIVFKGTKTTTAVTDNDGKIEIPLALDEKITSASQFTASNFQVVDLLTAESRSVLTLRSPTISSTPSSTKKSGFDIQIDSIKSLDEFYTLFKNYQTQNLTPETRIRLNERLRELMNQFSDSVKSSEVQHMAKVSDSTKVSEDIKNIISQATVENAKLTLQHEQFNDKIRVINTKLSRGVLNMDDKTRSELLADITRLEIILESNRSSFYKNQEDYRIILNTIKEKFLDIEDLQNKLTISESQRQEDEEEYRKKLIITISIASLAAIIVVILIYLSIRLRKQQQALILANEEVKHVNENLEQLVNERTRLLEETNHELDTFLYQASHNLRSPVSSIIGLYNIAVHDSDPKSMELFERTVQTAYFMDRLLVKLKVMSEINRPGNLSTFPLRPLIADVVANYEKYIRDHRVTVTVECADDQLMHSNRNLVEAILSSLVENAAFYSSLKSTVTPEIKISVVREKELLRFIIGDNGVGIAPELQTKIFDMFFVGNERSEGNGLGLYIVQKAVHAIKGTILVESEVNDFTRFEVRIPIITEI